MPGGIINFCIAIQIVQVLILYCYVIASYGDQEDEDANRRVHREDDRRVFDYQEQPASVNYQNTHSLHLYVMQSYNRHLRPGIGKIQPLTCNFSMIITHLDNVDEERQTIDLHGWVVLQWYDDRLSWRDHKDYNSTAKLVMPQHFIWRPDLHLYNNAESKVDTLVSSNTLAHIHSDGLVIVDPPISLRCHCEFNFAHFPWDEQSCVVGLGSWAYRYKELRWQSNQNVTSIFQDSQRAYQMNWRIVNASVVLSKLEFEKEEWHYINVMFSLKRASTFAAYFVLIPAFVNAFLSAIAFLFTVNKNGQWKLVLILSALAFEIIHLLAIYSRLPSLVFNARPNTVVLCISTIFITIIFLVIGLLTSCVADIQRQPPQLLTDLVNINIIKSIFLFPNHNVESPDSARSPSRIRRQRNQGHAILVTNQLGVTKRISGPYADDAEYGSRHSSRPSSPNDSFRYHQQPQTSNIHETGRNEGHSVNRAAWSRFTIILDRVIFLILILIYAILWAVCVGANP